MPTPGFLPKPPPPMDIICLDAPMYKFLKLLISVKPSFHLPFNIALYELTSSILMSDLDSNSD